MSSVLKIFFWSWSLLFAIIGLSSYLFFDNEKFRIIPLLVLLFGLILALFTYYCSQEYIQKKYSNLIKILSVLLFWFILIIIILFAAEQYLRSKNGFDLVDLSLKTHLVPSGAYKQNDIRRIFNSKYLEDNNLDLSHAEGDIFDPKEYFGIEINSPPYLFKKNTEYSYENGIFKPLENNEEVHIKINSLGFRGNEVDPNRKLTVLCLGASTTEGANSNELKSYPNQLQQMINEYYDGIQVINMGHSGYTPNDIYNLLKFNLSLKPDIIIFFEGNGNSLDKKEVYSDQGFSLSEFTYNLYKRSYFSRILLNIIPDFYYSIYFDNHPHTFDLNNDRPTKQEYFSSLEKIIDLSYEKGIMPILVTPINGWNSRIEISNEEFLNMQQELHDYWPLSINEIELFYKDYADGYKKLANEKEVKLIDIENDFKDKKSLFLNAENKLTDLHHLSAEGNERLAKLILNNIRDILNDIDY